MITTDGFKFYAATIRQVFGHGCMHTPAMKKIERNRAVHSNRRAFAPGARTCPAGVDRDRNLTSTGMGDSNAIVGACTNAAGMPSDEHGRRGDLCG